MFANVIAGDEDNQAADRGNAHLRRKSVVVDDPFDWGRDKGLRRPMAETITDEAQVKGSSKLWRELPENLRDTYWKGDDSQTADLVGRLTGSSNLYQDESLPFGDFSAVVPRRMT